MNHRAFTHSPSLTGALWIFKYLAACSNHSEEEVLLCNTSRTITRHSPSTWAQLPLVATVAGGCSSETRGDRNRIFLGLSLYKFCDRNGNFDDCRPVNAAATPCWSLPARWTVGKWFTQTGRAAEDTGQTGGHGAASPARAGPPGRPDPAVSRSVSSFPPAFPFRKVPATGPKCWLRPEKLLRDGEKGDVGSGRTPGRSGSALQRGAGPERSGAPGGDAPSKRSVPGRAREGQPRESAFGRGQQRWYPHLLRGAEQQEVSLDHGAGVISPPRNRRPSAGAAGAMRDPLASPPPPRPPAQRRLLRGRPAGSRRPGAAGRRARGRRCQRRRALSVRPAPTSREAPPASGGECGVDASRARRPRGGRCFPRHNPAGGARPWPVPVRAPAEVFGPPAPSGTRGPTGRVSGSGRRHAPLRGVKGRPGCTGAGAEPPRRWPEVTGRPGEVPRQRRERCHRKSR